MVMVLVMLLGCVLLLVNPFPAIEQQLPHTRKLRTRQRLVASGAKSVRGVDDGGVSAS